MQRSKLAVRWLQPVAVMLLVVAIVLAAARWGLSVLLLAVLAMSAVAVVIWPRQSLYALFALVPLSIPFSAVMPGLSADFWFPTEPMIALLLVLLLLRLLQQRGAWQSGLTKEPIFWAIALFFACLLISTAASIMPVVSAKYTLVRLWFMAVFFYLTYIELRQQPQHVAYKLWGYVAGMTIVAVYTMLRQNALGLFDRQVAQYTCVPFFPDHTSYGAALAIALPMALGLARVSRLILSRLLAYAMAAIFAVALLLSYTRAAWIGLMLAGGLWLLCKLRMPLRRMLLLGTVGLLMLIVCWPQMMRYMQHTEAESIGGLQHLRSVTNITTDESNVERLNRWSCAWLMFREKPLLGFGPGTYQFAYAPYQHSRFITMASTNRGDRGGAHSEYLGMMAECGILSTLAFVLLIAIVLVKLINIAVQMPTGFNRPLVLAILVAFVSFVTHLFLNNFLDIDKLAAPFWLAMAVVVVFPASEQSA